MVVLVVVADGGQQSLILHAEDSPLLLVSPLNNQSLRRSLLTPRLLCLLLLVLVVPVLTGVFPLPDIPARRRSEAFLEHWVDDVGLSLAEIIIRKETTERIPVVVVRILMLMLAVVPHFQDFFGLDFILFLFNRFPGPGRSKRLETRHLGAVTSQHYAGSARLSRTVRRQERLGRSRC